jgi:hypothetical protein
MLDPVRRTDKTEDARLVVILRTSQNSSVGQTVLKKMVRQVFATEAE